MLVTQFQPASAAEEAQKKGRAIERTRKTVRMLDDVYKSAVVLITTHYVNDEDDLPAGSAAIALFDAVKKKGWHEVKLLDVTGEALEANLPLYVGQAALAALAWVVLLLTAATLIFRRRDFL